MVECCFRQDLCKMHLSFQLEHKIGYNEGVCQNSRVKYKMSFNLHCCI